MKYKNAVLALHGLDAATDEDLYAADKYACDVQHIMRNGDNGIPADAPEWVAELQTSMETRVATGVVAQMTAAIAQMTAAIAQLNVTMNAGFSNQAAAIADLRQDGNALKSDVNALTVRIGVLEHSSSAKRIMALTHNKNCTGLAYPLMSVPKKLNALTLPQTNQLLAFYGLRLPRGTAQVAKYNLLKEEIGMQPVWQTPV